LHALLTVPLVSGEPDSAQAASLDMDIIVLLLRLILSVQLVLSTPSLWEEPTSVFLVFLFLVPLARLTQVDADPVMPVMSGFPTTDLAFLALQGTLPWPETTFVPFVPQSTAQSVRPQQEDASLAIQDSVLTVSLTYVPHVQPVSFLLEEPTIAEFVMPTVLQLHV